jgi:hypothetical protein
MVPFGGEPRITVSGGNWAGRVESGLSLGRTGRVSLIFWKKSGRVGSSQDRIVSGQFTCVFFSDR